MFNFHFKTYEDYMRALAESFISEFHEEYPEYREEMDGMAKLGIDIDETYIRHFLNSGLDPQTGMEKMIETMTANARYSGESVYLLKFFIDAGASLYDLTEKIFCVPDVPDVKYVEDAIYDHGLEVRLQIIDKYAEHLNQDYIKDYTDWTKIQAILWEDVIFGANRDSIDPKLVFLQHYKYSSKYIQSL